MSFFQRIVWVFTSPSRLFAEIREGHVSWWQPWLLISIVYMVVGYFLIPVQRVVTELNEMDLPVEQVDQTLEWMDKFGVLQLLGTPVVILLMTLALTGLAYIAVSVMAKDANFKRYLTLSFYSSVIGMVPQVISVVIVRMRGIDAIESSSDAFVSVGLRFLAPDSMMAKALFGVVDVFTIWSLVFIGMGVMAVFGLRRGQAIAAVIPWVVFAFILQIVSQLSGGVG